MKKINTVSLETTREGVFKLLQEHLMISIDLNLTQIDKESIQNLKIEKDTNNFNYWGTVNNAELLSNLGLYLKTVGENSEETIGNIANLIVRIAKNIARHFNLEFVWIESRSSIPNNTFDTSRWHTDTKFFAPHQEVYKLVVAIKGTQTRFGTTAEPERFSELSTLENKEKHGSKENIRIRKEIDLIVEEIQLPKKENATIYLVGGEGAVIHSEPQIHEQRLFVAILPGQENQINEWYNRKKKKEQRKR